VAKKVVAIKCSCGELYRTKLTRGKPNRPCPKCGKQQENIEDTP
jgi:hypothetical protein